METLRQPIPRYFDQSNHVSSRRLSTPDLFNKKWDDHDGSFMVSISVPGECKEKLNVYIAGRILVITAKVQTDHSKIDSSSKHKSFKHSFILPDGADTDRVNAQCCDGVLTITIDKKKSKRSHRIIKVMHNGSDIQNTFSVKSWWQRLIGNLNSRRLIPY